MPFVQVGGEIGAGLPASRLIVEPDQILAVQRGFEDEHDRIRDWIDTNAWRLTNVPSPGADPCSKGTVEALGENGQTALDAARGYLNQLEQVALSSPLCGRCDSDSAEAEVNHVGQGLG